LETPNFGLPGVSHGRFTARTRENFIELFKVSSAKVISVARKVDSNCSIVRGPMMGAVTMGLCKSQAKATAAGGSPNSLHKAS
jgi:hypothetical protein